MKDINTMCPPDEAMAAEVSEGSALAFRHQSSPDTTLLPPTPTCSRYPLNFSPMVPPMCGNYRTNYSPSSTSTMSARSPVPSSSVASPSSSSTTSEMSFSNLPDLTLVKTEPEEMPFSPATQEQFSRSLSPISQARPKRTISPGMTVSGNLLPPCRICLDKASGFHYGLNTCEACKGFFRRSLKRGASYVCTRDGKCDVTGERRNLCGYCRYQKCIALGMSKKAIKTGRYTHAKRTKDTLEIKKLMRAENGTPDDEEESIDVDEIVTKIVKAHDEYIISSTKVPLSFIQERQKQKLDELKLQHEMFGKMVTVPQEKHKEIYELTGLDLDNRREIMNFHVRNSERWIRGYISFAKNLPGFRDLTLNDQANLVKCARIEFWFLGSFPGYSSELGVAVMPNGRCFTRDEMYSVWHPKYIDTAFDLAQQLKKLNINTEELIITKAICLTFADRCKMEEPEKVERVQWRLVRCLLCLLKRSHPSHASAMRSFSMIINCLTGLRDLNEAEYQTLQSTQLYEVFHNNPLIMEVLPY